MSIEYDQVASSHNAGKAILSALGLWNTGRLITKVVITLASQDVVLVQVTEEIRVATASNLVEVISDYKLVPVAMSAPA